MKLAGRVQAAIDILHEVTTRHRPAAEALKDWGKAHRFAGSGDRHAIGTLVYDALRQKMTFARQGGGDDARRVMLGLLRGGSALSLQEIVALTKEDHAPAPLSADEKSCLAATYNDPLPNIPDWLLPAFGDHALQEGIALAQRAPVDLRVNFLKTDREKLLEALKRFHPVAGPFVDTSVRIAAPGSDERHANVEVEPAHGMGWFEVQDTASQIAAALTGAKAGEHVADVCAGAGGKTLALAARMQNTGRLVAHDVDRHRLRPIFERINRSGASCIEVLGAEQGAQMQEASFDCVVVDAPCSGTGTWRRKPEIKWKLTRRTLDARLTDQRNVLANAAKLVRPGGRLAYFTCSLLPEENSQQIAAFLAANKDFKVIPYAEQWSQNIGGEVPVSVEGSKDTLTLSPNKHGVDGFFVAMMQRLK
jgi:16S rRNA (cytosine967-C5)-methyltransferase